MVIDTCVLLFTAAVAAPLIFFVSGQLGQGPVRSSAGLSLLVACFFYVFPHSLNPMLVKNIPVVFIGASFIGMVSARLASSYIRIGFAGLIFCFIYLNTSRFFTGYGGALGTTASISLLVALALPVLNLRGRFSNGFNQLRKAMYGEKETPSSE